jgi:hypothetical protein
MKKRLLLKVFCFVTVIIVICLCSFVLVACGETPSIESSNTPNESESDNSNAPINSTQNTSNGQSDSADIVPTGLAGEISEVSVDVANRRIVAKVASNVDKFFLSQMLFNTTDAKYSVYTDVALVNGVTDFVMLDEGMNVFYLQLDADGTIALYTLIITREQQVNHVHQYGEWMIISQPTCTMEGTRQKTCQCGKVISESIDKVPHSEAKDVAVPATCTTAGKTAGTHCSVCGEVLEPQQIIEPLNHLYVGLITAATCTEQGYTTYTCQRCGDSYKDSYQAIVAHTLVHHDAQAPTCTNKGWDAYDTCAHCDYTTYKQIAALEHNYESITTTPTCTEQGYTTYTCQRCGDSYVGNYVSPTHTWGDWVDTAVLTCTTNGLRYHICTICGELARETLYAEGHKGEWVVTEEATCTATGIESFTCTVCQETLVRQLPQLAHTWSDWTITEQPTCIVGKRQHVCTVCSLMQIEFVAPAVNHTWGEDDICTNCKEHKPTEGLKYSISGTEATVTGYGGNTTLVYIPSSYQGYAVTSIGRSA